MTKSSRMAPKPTKPVKVIAIDDRAYRNREYTRTIHTRHSTRHESGDHTSHTRARARVVTSTDSFPNVSRIWFAVVPFNALRVWRKSRAESIVVRRLSPNAGRRFCAHRLCRQKRAQHNGRASQTRAPGDCAQRLRRAAQPQTRTQFMNDTC